MGKNLKATQLERAYRRLSPVYDLVFGRGLFHHGRRAAIECAELRPGDRVLDVGCGTGLNLVHYPAGCQIVGVDASPQMLERARQRIDRLGLTDATVQEMDAARLQFADGTFDKAVATYLVSAVAEPAEVLREMRRVVKPGGSFVVLNHFRRAGSWGGRFDDAVAPVCRRLGWNTDLELEPLLEEAGIRPQRVRPLRVLGGLFGGWQLLRFTNGAPS